VLDVRIVLELCAFLLFLAGWVGYERYHTARTRQRPGATRYGRLLARQAHWIDAVVARDEPLFPVHTLRTLSRQASFLGSLALLAVGGAFGLLLSSERFQALCEVTRLFGHPSYRLLQLKMLVLVAVLAYAFLAFVWGVRALLAAHLFTAGLDGEEAALTAGLRRYLGDFQLDFRHGLRGAYYGVDLMVWLFSTELFIVATIALTIFLARYDLAREADA
jgi:uncharacterized membrane protein